MSRTEPGPPAPLEGAGGPGPRETRTDSGIRVVSESMPSMRSASLGLWFEVGSRDERPDEDGCSHLLEHLLFKGTARRSTRDIAEELDRIGGEANAFTSKEATCFHARVLDRDVPVAMDVLADMARRATNAAVDVESERAVVLDEIRTHLDAPDDLAHADLAEMLFDGHRLGAETLGSATSVAAMGRDTIDGYYRTHYRPGALVVAAAGRVDHDVLVALAEDLLGDLGRPGRAQRPRTAPTQLATGRVHVRVRPTEQAHVVVGGTSWDVTDPRRPALTVATTILGGGMSSRLFQEVREARGLAYATYAYTSAWTDAGMFAAYAGTMPDRVDEVAKVLVAELERLPTTIERRDVDHARAAVTGALVLANEDTDARMGRLGHLATTEQPLESVDDAVARIQRLDVDDVRDAARVFAGPRSMAVVGPLDQGPAPLETFVG